MNEESAQSLLLTLHMLPEKKMQAEEKQQTHEEASEKDKDVAVKEKMAVGAEKEASEKEKDDAVKEKTVLDVKKEAIGEKKEVVVKEKEKTVLNEKEKVIEEKETPLDTRERCWKGVINGVEFTFVVSVPSQTSCRIAIRRKGSCKLFYSPRKNEVPFTAVFRNQSVSFSVDPKSKIKELRANGLMVVFFALSQV